VPEGTERVRVCLHAGNTTEQIDKFVACVREWLEKAVIGTGLQDGINSLTKRPMQQSGQRSTEALLPAKI
jgi:hypothetical protein